MFCFKTYTYGLFLVCLLGVHTPTFFIIHGHSVAKLGWEMLGFRGVWISEREGLGLGPAMVRVVGKMVLDFSESRGTPYSYFNIFIKDL
jgi:hypothetical protein